MGASTYMKPLLKEMANQSYLTNYKVTRVYPIKDNADTVGFRLSKEEAIKVATQLLIAAQLSDQIFLQGSRKDQTVAISRYNTGDKENEDVQA
ncbi:hypothetical protein COJ85_10125 [Bacillus sp. AFS076308]|uniref:hypothetical protein n=1 Tax=unclassified Bacillus (in: firmicutes) TaxID=185979 RepID=UPI000BF7B46C|nr:MULTISPECIES: hypothetical protein [unclassified Bacillus (in: firmicutes)]PFO05076.1 hypothetical protein COJ85_10125 [Bacillus sp. AFS076308]PGV50512.1 hypothetical protein COD92_17595 [Bacillus sp. AFS037270]